jgi:hypothetical protein
MSDTRLKPSWRLRSATGRTMFSVNGATLVDSCPTDKHDPEQWYAVRWAEPQLVTVSVGVSPAGHSANERRSDGGAQRHCCSWCLPTECALPLLLLPPLRFRFLMPHARQLPVDIGGQRRIHLRHMPATWKNCDELLTTASWWRGPCIGMLPAARTGLMCAQHASALGADLLGVRGLD